MFQLAIFKAILRFSYDEDYLGLRLSEIRVYCYSGYRAASRFTIRDREYNVQELDDQCYSPDATYFRVLADDGNYYVLRHDEGQDSWTLDGYRQSRSAE
jgi:hypothetical protein